MKFSSLKHILSATERRSPSEMEPFFSCLNLPLMSSKAFCQQVRQPRFKLWLKFALRSDQSSAEQMSRCVSTGTQNSPHALTPADLPHVNLQVFSSVYSVSVKDFAALAVVTAPLPGSLCSCLLSLQGCRPIGRLISDMVHTWAQCAYRARAAAAARRRVDLTTDLCVTAFDFLVACFYRTIRSLVIWPLRHRLYRFVPSVCFIPMQSLNLNASQCVCSGKTSMFAANECLYGTSLNFTTNHSSWFNRLGDLKKGKGRTGTHGMLTKTSIKHKSIEWKQQCCSTTQTLHRVKREREREVTVQYCVSVSISGQNCLV